MRFFRIIAAIVAGGLAVALLVAVYQAGVVAGAGSAGTAVAPFHWYGPGAWFLPWFGFGLFHLFGLILFVLLVVGLARFAFRAGHGRGWDHGSGPRGDWDLRMREYHDSLHAAPASAPTPSAQTPPTASPAPSARDDRPTGG